MARIVTYCTVGVGRSLGMSGVSEHKHICLPVLEHVCLCVLSSARHTDQIPQDRCRLIRHVALN